MHDQGSTNRSKSIIKSLRKEFDDPKNETTNSGTEIFPSQVVYKVVEQMPLFPGCDVADGYTEELKRCSMKKMLEFIYGNIKYPASALEAGVEGTGVISFIVGTDGEIMDAKVVQNPAKNSNDQVAKDFEKELLKISSAMPEWIPGQQQGKAVQVRFNLPVKFKLQ